MPLTDRPRIWSTRIRDWWAVSRVEKNKGDDKMLESASIILYLWNKCDRVTTLRKIVLRAQWR